LAVVVAVLAVQQAGAAIRRRDADQHAARRGEGRENRTIGLNVGTGAVLVTPEGNLVAHTGEQGAPAHGAIAIGVYGDHHAVAQSDLTAGHRGDLLSQYGRRFEEGEGVIEYTLGLVATGGEHEDNTYLACGERVRDEACLEHRQSGSDARLPTAPANDCP
jgi:hypothetical protein